ncbi:MAG: TIGR03960 family B12-binding radical SAM protein [Oscillospiraceae bacterium]|jgi:radical SAM family uncharacterized protein|nr:TIGR03960 family B12-binding radical SAM protein [Oscillospiraceae bacterium]
MWTYSNKELTINTIMTIEQILTRVQKPARYIGGEFGEIFKPDAEIRFALCFPDTYEIGMSNLGIQILYSVLNNMDGVSCERCFAPWDDMARELKSANLPLFALESGGALSDFDIIGFSLGYEMSYPAMLQMLELANIEPYSKNRGNGLSPIIVAGGACIANPEPIAPFIDLAVFGDGEEAIAEITELYRRAKREGLSKRDFLKLASELEGIYAPSVHKDCGNVKRRIVKDFDSSHFPAKTIVPSTEVVHDRAVLEIMRGCPNGCRFCQACFINAPVRYKSVDTLVKQAIAALKHTGAQELNLASLSTGDYPSLTELIERLLDYCEPRHINLSLPSLRVDSFSKELMERVQRTRKSGLTFAPEAGSQRLRDVINKNITEDEILGACRVAFEGGHSSVKLYFMIGLPEETDEDVLAIADLAYKVLSVWKESGRNKQRGVQITVSVACFVPKPGTPFAKFTQNSVAEFERKQRMLREKLKNKSIKYSWHNPQVSYVEWKLATGGRELAPVLLEVANSGKALQAWDEFFDFRLWRDALVNSAEWPDDYYVPYKGYYPSHTKEAGGNSDA